MASTEAAAASARFSPLQLARLRFQPALPAVLAAAATSTVVHDEAPAAGAGGVAVADGGVAAKLAALFPRTFGRPTARIVAAAASTADSSPAAAAGTPTPLRIGCVLSGGQAAGGHSVIAGLFDFIHTLHPHAESALIGFLDGPRGLFTSKWVTIDAELMGRYRHLGGFDIIGSGRDKIETPEQFEASMAAAAALRLDGVIIIGGDDSNTNAALLAEYFAAHGSSTRVVGCPKTIDGDLKIAGQVDISFGFDTACKTYSELIGNVCVDSLSSNKYYNLIRLMGRAASNITLECALQTHPTMALIGEEVQARHQSLAAITEEIVAVVLEREALGLHHGVILVPEGLIEFVPEVSALLGQLNELLAGGTPATEEAVSDALSANNAALFAFLPPSIKRQLLAERDPHGNVQVSLIETEKLLAELVAHELARHARAGTYHGTFTPQCMFFGYEARCALPSDFDVAYCYALGYNAALLVARGETGVMSTVTALDEVVENWGCGGTPLTRMMTIERRKGKDKPVIRKALVDLHGLPFRTFAEHRHAWAVTDSFRYPGPIQHDVTGKRQRRADGTHVDPLTFTLALELKERAAAGGSGASAASPSHAEGAARTGDVAGYTALCEGLLSEGVEALSSRDLTRLSVYRAAHAISDADHAEVLRKLGLGEADWAAAVRRIRSAAAAAAAATVATGGGGAGAAGK